MLSLILETSCEKGCVVLAENGAPLRFAPLPAGPELSKTLALEVEKLLGGIRPDLIAVGTGPGSYTGIRVGAALGKGLAYGWTIPLFGFCSLRAFGPGPVLVDARGPGFYALLGDEPLLLSPTDERLQKNSCYLTPHPAVVKKRFDRAGLIEANPNPKWLANLVYRAFLEGNLAPLELNYLSCP